MRPTLLDVLPYPTRSDSTGRSTGQAGHPMNYLRGDAMNATPGTDEEDDEDDEDAEVLEDEEFDEESGGDEDDEDSDDEDEEEEETWQVFTS